MGSSGTRSTLHGRRRRRPLQTLMGSSGTVYSQHNQDAPQSLQTLMGSSGTIHTHAYDHRQRHLQTLMGSSGTSARARRRRMCTSFKPSWVRLEHPLNRNTFSLVRPFKPSWVRLELLTDLRRQAQPDPLQTLMGSSGTLLSRTGD